MILLSSLLSEGCCVRALKVQAVSSWWLCSIEVGFETLKVMVLALGWNLHGIYRAQGAVLAKRMDTVLFLNCHLT